jgi:hypothetical protein
MSNMDLVPFRPSGGLQRQVRRELTRLTVETGLTATRIESRAEIEAARASAVASVGQRAMQEIAMITKLERDLAETVPAANARLTSLGDMTLIALGGVVMNAARHLGQPVMAFFLGLVIGAFVCWGIVWFAGRGHQVDELERLRTQELMTMWQIDAISRGAQAQMRRAASEARECDWTA